jgi:hypothetical protein
MTGALDAFDEMVEALEENEDMVECKECFDLFPKTDCEKSDVGYVCPVCKGLRAAPARTEFVDPYSCYTQDFPEVADYNPDSVVDYEREPDLGDALSDLIKDEYEAIDGYEIADETIQKADIEENDKDEILDTLDHIKEEEEEHIDELKELCPECDKEAEAEAEIETDKKEDDLDELFDANVNLSLDGGEGNDVSVLSSHDPEDKGSEKLAEDAAEDVEEEPEDVEDFEEESESEDEGSEELDLEAAYAAAIEVANETGVGQVFGYAKKDTEEFVAIDLIEVDDPEAIEQDLEAVYDDMGYAYVAFPEKTLEESLFESVQLHEANFFTGEDKYLNKLFGANGYVIKVRGQDIKHTAPTYKEAEKLAIKTSKAFPNSTVDLYGAAMSPEDYNSQTPEIKQLLAKNGVETVIAIYDKGKAKQVDKAAELTKAMKNITKYQKAVGKSTDAQAAAKADAEAGAEKGASAYEANATEAGETTSEVEIGSTSTETKVTETPIETEKGKEIDSKETEVDSNSEEAEEVEVAPAPAVKPETFELLDKIFAKGYASIIDGELKKYTVGPNSVSARVYKALQRESSEGDLVYFCAKPIHASDLTEAGDANAVVRYLQKLIGQTDQKVIKKFNGSAILLAAFKDGKAVTLKKKASLLSLIEKNAELLNEYLTEEALEVEKEEATDASAETAAKEPTAEKTSKKKNIKTDKIRAKKSISSLSDEDLIALISGITGNRYVDPTKAKNAVKRARAFLKGKGFATESFTPAELTEILQENFLREEYHKYANPAELTAMDNLRVEVDKIVEQLVQDLAADGYDDLDYYDSDCYMSGNNACTITMFLGSEDTFEDGEAEELQDHMTNIVEEALAQIKLPPELIKVQGGALFPDTMIMDEDDEANGITRGEISVDVYFARKLI